MAFENILGKGENTYVENYLLFPKYFLSADGIFLSVLSASNDIRTYKYRNKFVRSSEYHSGSQPRQSIISAKENHRKGSLTSLCFCANLNDKLITVHGLSVKCCKGYG